MFSRQFKKRARHFATRILPAVALAGVGAYEVRDIFRRHATANEDVSYTRFCKLADQRDFSRMHVDEQDAVGEVLDGKGHVLKTYSVTLPKECNVKKEFPTVEVDFKSHLPLGEWGLVVGTLALALYTWQLKQVTEKEGRFFKKKAFKPEKSSRKLKDFAGLGALTDEAMDLVRYLRGEKPVNASVASQSKGVLLTGLNGNGKNYLAKAIAGEAGVPMISLCAEEFENPAFGNAARQIADLADSVHRHAPCVVFIDTIDDIAHRKEDDGSRGGMNTRNTLMRLLDVMETFSSADGVLFIATTERPEVLDPVVQWPGHFEHTVHLPEPAVAARHDYLVKLTRGRPLGSDVDLDSVARDTAGFTFVDIQKAVNAAARAAGKRHGAPEIMDADFDAAVAAIRHGAGKAPALTEEQKRTKAVHESGHGLLHLLLEEQGMPPLRKISIAPHDDSLGLGGAHADEARPTYTRRELENMLVVLYGGPVAEELVNGRDGVSTFGEPDLAEATQYATAMATRYGFSDVLGAVSYRQPDGAPGEGLDDLVLVNRAVRLILKTAKNKARDLLTPRVDTLRTLTEELLSRETLHGDNARTLIKTKAAPAGPVV